MDGTEGRKAGSPAGRRPRQAGRRAGQGAGRLAGWLARRRAGRQEGRGEVRPCRLRSYSAFRGIDNLYSIILLMVESLFLLTCIRIPMYGVLTGLQHCSTTLRINERATRVRQTEGPPVGQVQEVSRQVLPSIEYIVQCSKLSVSILVVEILK